MAKRLQEEMEEAAAEATAGLKIIDQKETEQKAEQASKTTNDKVIINFRWSKSRVKEFKKFFGARGLSMARGILMCVEDEIYRTKNGKIEITETGIRDNKLLDL
jgi:hypothetical protein